MQGNFTYKAQEALMAAQDIAREYGQQQIDALHLLFALVSQPESIVLTLLQKLAVDTEGLKNKTKQALRQIPTIATPQTFGQFYLTQDMAKVLDRARQESQKFGDEFISVEHFLLALLDTETKAREVLQRSGFLRQTGSSTTMETGKLTYEDTLKTLNQMRGGQRILIPLLSQNTR